jgi:hypothetical protein
MVPILQPFIPAAVFIELSMSALISCLAMRVLAASRSAAMVLVLLLVLVLLPCCAVLLLGVG